MSRYNKPRRSLEDFARRPGVAKAIQDFKHRKEKKRVQTAHALRQYAKVMQKEGYTPGRGASRKREENEAAYEEDAETAATTDTRVEATTRKADTSADSARQEATINARQHTRKDTKSHRSRPQKYNPIAQNRNKAIQQKQDVADKKAQAELERNERLKERKERTRLLTSRTKKGQPVMQNIVHDILNKLERENKHK
jgi:rRNA processing